MENGYKKASTLLNDALKMLGYSDSDGNAELTGRLRNRAIVTVNLVYGDLWRVCKSSNGGGLSFGSTNADSCTCDKRCEPMGEFEPITSLSDEIKLPPKATGDVFLYGLAMHIARSENDGDQQQYFTMLYNSRRAGLTQYDKVKNVIPRGADQ